MDKSTGIPLSKKYNFMSVRFSCKSSQRFSERNRFPTSLIWLSTSEPRSVSDRLVCSLKLLPNSQYIIHAQNNGINRSYKDRFLRDSSFYWQTAQNKANMTSWKWAIFASRRPCYPALKRGWSYLIIGTKNVLDLGIYIYICWSAKNRLCMV